LGAGAVQWQLSSANKYGLDVHLCTRHDFQCLAHTGISP
jgi:hypothetical protein